MHDTTTMTLGANNMPLVHTTGGHHGNHNYGLSNKDYTVLGDREIIRDVNITAAATNLNVEKNGAAINLNVEKTTSNILLSQTLSNASLQSLISTGNAANALAICHLDAKLSLQASQLAAQASKEAAECCCEIKEKISEDGQKTRQLINDNTIGDLHRQIAALTAHNTNLIIRNPTISVCG